MVLTDDKIFSEIVARDIQILMGGQEPLCLAEKKDCVLPANQQIIREIVSRDIEKVYVFH